MSQQSYTLQEVSTHNNEQSCWLVIDRKVYDVTRFLNFHPAGKNIILEYAGQDCTEVFKLFHPPTVLEKYAKFIIGDLTSSDTIATAPVLKFPNAYGSGIPYADPTNVQGWLSPYYTENHHQLRKAIRSFLEKEIFPNVDKWDENYEMPKEALKKVAQQGIFALVVGQPWPEKYYPEKKVCGVTLENQNMFHENIFYEEVNRCGSGGLMWAIVIGTGIGLPPVIKFGSDDLKSRYVTQCLTGEKQICLAVTEPWVGSDVAGLRTTAKKTPCGKYYIVNGMKKFITNGIFADCFTTAVRTGGPGAGGISMLVIDRNLPGVKTRKMKMTGVWMSGTTFIIFENVKVPVENLIGKENDGFKYTMVNFNHERLQIAVQSNAMARCAYEECMKFANRRKTFGKYLIEHPVIRNKLAHMVRQIEATQAFIDQCTYNFDNMPKNQNIQQLTGAIALLKAQATTTLQYCVNEGIQVLGGQGYQRGGVGGKVERLYRESKAMTLGGGAEEIMLDLGIRQAVKIMPKI